MADIRIKDLATTATTTASDDFMAVDGVTNGTRKLSAATPAFLTSVTTPSLTSPAATDLTLAGGSSGASLVLGQGGNGTVVLGAPTGASISLFPGGADNILITPSGSGATLGYIQVPTSSATRPSFVGSSTSSGIFFPGGGVVGFSLSGAEMARFSGSSNLLIGTTSETGLTGAGGLKIASTTAGASNAGALVVAGGLSAGNNGNASYFGGAATFAGAVTIGNTVTNVSPTSPNRTVTMVVNGVTLYLAAKTSND